MSSSANQSSSYAVVADIGGTNARFSRVDLNNLEVDKITIMPCADFSSLEEAWYFYLNHQQMHSVKEAAIAIACPVKGDLISMTNFHWQFSVQTMKQQLGLNRLHVMNDFTAQAMCLPVLKSAEKIKIGAGEAHENQPMVVLGAGTGLGVAHLVPSQNGYIPVAGEGGHSDWPVHTEQEWFIHQYLSKVYGHVSAERLLSGSGLENLYQALAAYRGQSVFPLDAAEIAAHALEGYSVLAIDTVEQFFASLGAFAGNLALNAGAFGGIYLAGGIVPKLLPMIRQSSFRERFEKKGRFEHFNRQIPTYVVLAEQPGLLGAAVYLKQKMDNQHEIC